MELIDIVEVKETHDEQETNELLKVGWVLLSSGFTNGSAPYFDHHIYSLGLPKDVAASLKPKEYPDGVNF